MKFIYPAIFKKTEQGSYEGYFPDLDCCYGRGETLDDAVENANENANDWIMLELEEENGLPPVTDLQDIELQEGEIARNISITLRFYDGYDE